MSRADRSTRQEGTSGEQAAARYLERSGYRILARNFRTRKGEIDIVAVDGRTLVFVEVKSWKAFDFGDLEISIDRRKRKRIIEASRVYLMKEGLTAGMRVRYDLVFVKGDSLAVEHLHDAFTESTWSG